MISFYFKLFLILAFSQGFIFLGIPESHVVRLPAFINHRQTYCLVSLSLSSVTWVTEQVKILVFLGVELRDNLFFFFFLLFISIILISRKRNISFIHLNTS